MSTYNIFAKGVGLAGISQVITAIKGVILLPILTKALGAESYGIWSLIMVTISWLVPIALMQLEYAMTRFLTAEDDKAILSKGISSIFAVVILTSFTIMCSIFVLSKPLSAMIGNQNNFYLIEFSAILILSTILETIMLRYFVSFHQMGIYTVLSILQTICELLLITYLISSGFGLIGAIISLLIVRVFVCIIGFVIIITQVSITIPSLHIIKSYLLFSMPLIPFTFCWLMIDSGDRYVIEYFMGAKWVGIYSASCALGSVLAFLSSPISLVFLPTITHLYDNNKIRELEEHIGITIKFFILFSIPSIFGISILSKSLMAILTSSEFISEYLIIPIVMAGIIFFSFSKIFSDLLILFKRTKTVSALFGFCAVIKLVMTIILVPSIGLFGAAIASLITFFILLVMIGIIAFKAFPFNCNFRFLLKSLLSSIIMGVVIWNMASDGVTEILFSIASGTAIYFGVLFLLNGFSKEEYVYAKDLLSCATKIFHKN